MENPGGLCTVTTEANNAYANKGKSAIVAAAARRRRGVPMDESTFDLPFPDLDEYDNSIWKVNRMKDRTDERAVAQRGVTASRRVLVSSYSSE